MAEKRKEGLKINIDYLLAAYRVQVAPFHSYFLLLFLLNILSPSTRSAGLHNSWFSSALPTGSGATAISNNMS